MAGRKITSLVGFVTIPIDGPTSAQLDAVGMDVVVSDA